MRRILTEKKNLPDIENILIGLGMDYTYYEATGSWKGKREHSLVIELDNYPFSKVLKAAEEIRKLNGQEAVYVQEIPTSLLVVSEKGVKSL